ncbi:hypothetical protein [Flavobacterium aestivum]|uniref:hypothetical protein n=1 Tax=Flavobacterium aestivum TaxID=3003257 RepID=UPI0024830575|nr:hypothetical protein [Flavobacterium aestivum]
MTNKAFEFIKQNPTLDTKFIVSLDNIIELEEKLGYSIPTYIKEFWLEFGAFQYFNSKEFTENDLNEIVAVYIYSNIGIFDCKIYSVYNYFTVLVDDENTSMLGDNFQKEKEFLSSCFWIYCFLNEIVDGKKYNQFFYIDALGNSNSFRIEDNEAITFVEFIDKLVALKPNYTDFLDQQEQKQARILAQEQEEIVEAKKEEDRKKLAKENFLVKHGFKIKTYQETLDLLGVNKMFDTYDDNDFEEDEVENNEQFLLDYNEEDLDEIRVYYADGDVSIDGDFIIPNDNSWNIIIVVNGNLVVHGYNSLRYYVTGNATFEWLSMNNFQICLGVETVKYIQEQLAEDDEALKTSRKRKVSAPYFFSWFYNLDSYIFDAKTVIIALYDYDELKSFETENAIFRWHDAAYALKKELFYSLDESWHDPIFWNNRDIFEVLKEEKSIFRDGFDILCMPSYQKGVEYSQDEDFGAAFVCFNDVTKQSPNFYLGWFNCGKILYKNNAYVQAISYFENAIKCCLPFADTGYAYENAAKYLAFCYLRKGDYQKSIELTKDILTKVENDKGFVYRIQAESHLLLNKNEEALSDLELAYEDNQHLPVLWLTGLAHFRLNNKSKSDNWLAKARTKQDNVPSYEETESLEFYTGINVNFDWENQKVEDIKIVPKGQDFYDEFFKKYQDIAVIPEEFITQKMVEWTYNHDNQKRFWGATFRTVPKRLLTKDIVMLAFTHPLHQPDFIDVPVEFMDKEFCLKALNVSLENVPEEILDREIYLDAVGKNYTNLKFVPNQFKDDDMYVRAVSSGVLSEYSGVVIPKKFAEQEFILKAIEIDIDALNKIPNKYIDATVFEAAKKLYENHNKWEETVTQHSFNGTYEYDTFDKVWPCFYTEKFILETLNKADERILDIPSSHITAKIAEVAIKKNSYDLQFVPIEFLTPELCESASGRDYGSSIAYIPVAMRSEKVSQNAMSRDIENIKFVPKEFRTNSYCLKALKENLDLLDYIPYENYIAVMDVLLKDHQDDFDKEFSYYYRGFGYLFIENYENAIIDFIALRNNRTQDEGGYAESLYYEGWANFKLGRIQKAQELFDQSQVVFKKEFPDALIDTPYERTQLPIIQTEIFDFNLEDFELKIQDINKYVTCGYPEEALQEIIEQEKKLKESQCSDMNYWAMLWDHKRFALYATDRKEDCYSFCRETIKTLQKVTTWPYVAFDNNIRHALRSMNNTLAYHLFETATTFEDIKLGLEHNKKSFVKAPIEDEECFYWFYETKAELLQKAIAFDDKYQKELDKTIKKIIKLKLKRKSILSEGFIERFEI